MQLEIVVLAAGRGARMQSDLPKVLHPLAGTPLIGHVLKTATLLNPSKLHVVVGYGAEKVKTACADFPVNWVFQKEQLGTGHAVLQVLPQISPASSVLVLYGDVPLISEETLRQLIDKAGNGSAVLTANIEDPAGYGRVIRDQAGCFSRIVEDKDATSGEREVDEINTGVLVASSDHLNTYLPSVTSDNEQGEYYLPDVLSQLVKDKQQIFTVNASPREILGINDKVQLADAESSIRATRARALMDLGVTLIDPSRVDIRGDVKCGSDVVIDINVILEGQVVLDDKVKIGANSCISDSTIGAATVIHPMSTIEGATIEASCSIGPFARIRPGTKLSRDVKIGNFVETKNTSIGVASKASHLAYLGDAKIGSSSNIGAGTITCNYDGVKKHTTEIGDNTFVGSNSTLVAPLKISEEAFVSAGSTVTKDVASKELALGRSSQRNVTGWKRPKKNKPS